jgi:hypothetical protein
MNRNTDILLTDLRYMIADLGKNGGLIGPSVYDTAQTLRFAPPREGAWPALEWLLEQQRSDGGWGDPRTPMARDMATLAAVLALRAYATRKTTRVAIDAGVSFLRRQSAQWAGPPPDDIPLAAELVLPSLLDQARREGIDLPEEPYAALKAFGAKRRRLMAQLNIRPGTPPTHSWEAWGQNRDASLLDGAGSIGHSPAATAAWLDATREFTNLADSHAIARGYLEQAAQATGLGIPGVVPTVWPYERNEQSVSLFAVFLAGLFRHPALQEALNAQVEDMWRGLRTEGQGISDHFATDGDITAMDFAIVAAKGHRPNQAILERYIVGDSCLTYPNEMQRSFSATTHAAHTLAMLGGDPAPLLNYLRERRAPDGRWMGDKWHASWLYLTSHTIHALVAAEQVEEALSALPALLDHQRADGSWGVTDAASEETAYAVLGLLAFQQVGVLPATGQESLRRAGNWLLTNYRPLTEEAGACWTAKEMYRPRRISRTIEISATLACALMYPDMAPRA